MKNIICSRSRGGWRRTAGEVKFRNIWDIGMCSVYALQCFDNCRALLFSSASVLKSHSCCDFYFSPFFSFAFVFYFFYCAFVMWRIVSHANVPISICSSSLADALFVCRWVFCRRHSRRSRNVPSMCVFGSPAFRTRKYEDILWRLMWWRRWRRWWRLLLISH